MKAIIFLVSRSRYHIPRVGGFRHAPQFAAATYPNQPIVFEGRALDMAEFNTVATRLLDRRNPNLGYDVSVRLLDDVAVESPTPAPANEPEPVVETPVEVPASEFSCDGSDIFFEGHRVAMIGENGLRCAKGYAELRDKIEEWISNNQPESTP